jgi:SSS family solute:Na+ symporter
VAAAMAEGKGGWIADLHHFPSPMAQNFWIAIMAWSTCFVVTILVSLVTAPRPESELRGLVYGVTEIKHEHENAWYKRPVPIAIAIGALAILLNIIFA